MGRGCCRWAAISALALLLACVPQGAAAQAKPASPEAARADRVTLVTGDVVTVRGVRSNMISVVPGPGRQKIKFRQHVLDGHRYVFPSDAEVPIGRRRLDPRLFDITLLRKWRYGDRDRPVIPLIVERAKATTLSGATTATRLPALGMDALEVDKKRAGTVWAGLIGGARADTLGGGVTRVWLDGKRTALLDRSVPQIGAPAAWKRGHTGKGVTVAVLDTGHDATHPDLAGVVTQARGFTDKGAGDTRDGNGHGTHVASIVAGSGAASGGRYRGVAPDAKIASAKVLDDDGGGQESWILAGMAWAATTAKARVVNLSLGGQDFQGTDPLEKAVGALTTKTGTLFVIAAGNDGPETRSIASPGSAAAALTVGAVDGRHRLAEFSSRGPRVGDHAVKPDITAPGVNVTAARAAGSDIGRPVGTGYQRLSGTSMATPHVAGAAALVAQRHPGWRAGRLKAALTGTAAPGAAGVFEQGSGRVDVDRATRQDVHADTGGLSTYLRWPARGHLTRRVTYTNPTARPVTLTLKVSAGAAPKGLFRLSGPKVTVPARGSAQVLVRVSRTGVRPGDYGGALTATARNIRIRTALGVYVEPEAYDLTIRAVDHQGRPATSLLMVSSRRGGFDEWILVEAGTARLRFPAGNYNVHGFIDAAEPSACGSSTMVHLPVSLARTRTVVINARRARPARTTIDEPGAATIAFDRALSFGPGGYELSEFSFCPESAARVLPVRQRGLSYYHHTSWSRPDESRDRPSPYRYEVVDHRGGGLPADPSHHAKQRDMAMIRTAYRAQAGNDLGALLAGARLPGFAGTFMVGMELQLPAVQNVYVTAGPKLSWHREFEYGRRAGELLPGAALEARPRTLRPGHHREVWNAAAVGPALDLDGPPGYRTGDTLTYIPAALLSDAGRGHIGFDANVQGASTLSRGGTALARAVYDDDLVTRLPAGSGRYTLSVSVRRAVPYSTLSTKIDLAWTFASRRTARAAALPLQVVRYAPEGLDGLNQARPGSTTRIPLRVERAKGAPTATPRTVRVRASFDDGRTWRDLPVRPSGSAWTTQIANPATGFVSLQATVRDSAGNHLTQTIVRAYAIGG